MAQGGRERNSEVMVFGNMVLGVAAGRFCCYLWVRSMSFHSAHMRVFELGGEDDWDQLEVLAASSASSDVVSQVTLPSAAGEAHEVPLFGWPLVRSAS